MGKMEYEPLAIHVGGQWRSKAKCGALDVVNPATESVLDSLPLVTSDLDEALASAERGQDMAVGLECGGVGINSFSGSNPETPFGGVKDSGYGREGGTEGVRSYMTTKFVVEGSL